jgi:cyclophilin family peptidyl-prolyl cis-trans isomerase
VRRVVWLFVLSLGTLGCGSTNPVVEVDTTKGKFKIELYENDAPITVKNFLTYVDNKFYDDTIFHRVIKGFVIQAGGVQENGTSKVPRDTIKNESYNGLSNTRGTIAMARLEKADTASSNFYVNLDDNSSKLDRGGLFSKDGYCVFGKVIDGMNVVDAIGNAPVGRDDLPLDSILIKSIRRVESK